ncbi:MAG TPA: hypothetical protein VJP80_01000, partial [Candidatus Saccharimonadales bacterium]|nr:hypothetical protein [Candidatus Saccharimonadales bacterium]
NLEDVSGSFYAHWTTQNSSIATVDSYGTHTGMGLGSTTTNTAGWLNNNDHPRQCPLVQVFPSGNDNVQTPYQVEPIATIDSQQATPSFCGNNNMYGWIRDVTNQLQYQSGAPVRSAGITVGDTIQVDSQNNGLGIVGAQVDSYTTDSNGSWPDRYYVCSTACPGSLSQSLASQSWTWDGLGVPHVNSITYKCGSITIDGH